MGEDWAVGVRVTDETKCAVLERSCDLYTLDCEDYSVRLLIDGMDSVLLKIQCKEGKNSSSSSILEIKYHVQLRPSHAEPSPIPMYTPSNFIHTMRCRLGCVESVENMKP